MEVTLFTVALADRARQVVSYEEPPTAHMGEALYDCYHTGLAFKRIRDGGFDLVHDHAGFVGVAFADFLPIPMVHTLHGPFEPQVKDYYSAFASDVHYVAISRYQQQCCPGLNYAGVVYNAVDIEEHRPGGEKEDYWSAWAASARKGDHNAVRIALEHVIAVPGGQDRGRAGTGILPARDRTAPGRRARCLPGRDIPGREDRLLQRPAASLFPIQWRALGLVMTKPWPAAPGGRNALAPPRRWSRTGRPASWRTRWRRCPPARRVSRSTRSQWPPGDGRRFSPARHAEGYLEAYEKALSSRGLPASPGRALMPGV